MPWLRNEQLVRIAWSSVKFATQPFNGLALLWKLVACSGKLITAGRQHTGAWKTHQLGEEKTCLSLPPPETI